MPEEVTDPELLPELHEPATEPISVREPAAAVISPPPVISPLPAEPPPAAELPRITRSGFSRTRYRFTTGLRAGELARVRDDEGHVLFSYRSFASAAGVVAGLVSAIVLFAGIAATLLLVAEGAPLRALLAAGLTIVFTFLIGMLVPRAKVTLFEEDQPALTITQRQVFPSESYVVSAPNGAELALLRRGPFGRMGRNRWTITSGGQPVGHAVEESFGRALVRKVLGKFDRRFDVNVKLEYSGLDAGTIYRRGADSDVLELINDIADRRICVALATVILGREP